MKTSHLILKVICSIQLLASALHAQVPGVINYQGRIAAGPTNFEGTGQFKFALVNATGTTTFWSNNGTSVAGSEPSAAVALAVTKGLYSVLLGDTALTNMTAVPASVFANSDVRLRVWFNDGTNGSQQLSPDQRIASVGYAMLATNVSDGAITSAKIANGAVGSTQLAGGAVTSGKIAAGAVTASEIAGGAVGTSQIATGAVGSAQLADSVAFGSASLSGQLDVFRTSANTPAISLLGSASQISTFGSDGMEQIRLWGVSYGEVLLHDNTAANNVAVSLSANGSNGGTLSLRDGGGSERVNLRALDGSGGKLALIDDAGVTSLLLDSAASRQLEIVDAQSIVRMTSTNNTNGSVIELRNDTVSPSTLGAINFLDLNGATVGQIRCSGANDMLFMNGAGGSAHFSHDVVVTNQLASDTLLVAGTSTFADLAVTGNGTFNGNVGIGDTTPDAKLDVQQSSNTVAIFNRTTNDGTIISLQQDSATQGTISVAGNTVSYNAFTGSHYAWSDERLEFGQLVSMTGQSRRLHDNPAAEPIYGVKLASVANDARCLGAFLAPQDSVKPIGLENPLLIMAVGNGDLWVVDTGSDIHSGDYLICSDVPGCAMKDDPAKFPVGNIVARAAEAIDWSQVASSNGVKRAKISVLFGNFVREGDGNHFRTITADQSRRIQQLEAENADLRREQFAIRARLDMLDHDVREMRAAMSEANGKESVAATIRVER